MVNRVVNHMVNRRYLNCISVRRLFRAGDIDGAERTATLFTRDGDQINNLFDMQCVWYEIEAGNAHFRKGHMGRVCILVLCDCTHVGIVPVVFHNLSVNIVLAELIKSCRNVNQIG